MVVRCKFRVSKYETSLGGDRGTEELRTGHFNVVYDGTPENKQFFKWTPNGQIQIGLLNEAAWKEFPLGREVYVDFTDATKPAEV